MIKVYIIPGPGLPEDGSDLLHSPDSSQACDSLTSVVSLWKSSDGDSYEWSPTKWEFYFPGTDKARSFCKMVNAAFPKGLEVRCPGLEKENQDSSADNRTMFQQITFATIPNAQGPPHLGHVYNTMVNRALWRDCVRIYGKDIDIRWVMCFEKPGDEFHHAYHQLMLWLDFPLNACADWHHPAYCKMFARQAYAILAIPKSSIFITNNLIKLAWYTTSNVRFIARCLDHEMKKLHIEELSLAEIFRLNTPTSIYHATLLTEDGVKIDKGNSEPYQVSFSRDDPKQVMGYLSRTIGKIFVDANQSFCENRRESIKVPVDWRSEMREEDVELVPDVYLPGDNPDEDG